jgi:hypothetical protein
MSKHKPEEITNHLDHRVSALLGYIVEYGQNPNPLQGRVHLGNACKEGAMVMLRALIEFTGVTGKGSPLHLHGFSKPSYLCICDFAGTKSVKCGTALYDAGKLTRVGGKSEPDLVAEVYDKICKVTTHFKEDVLRPRSAPPGFDEIREAARIILQKIYEQILHPNNMHFQVVDDLYRLLPRGEWEGMLFESAKPGASFSP